MSKRVQLPLTSSDNHHLFTSLSQTCNININRATREQQFGSQFRNWGMSPFIAINLVVSTDLEAQKSNNAPL